MECVDVTRYQHAARELERFARLRLYEATDKDTEANARTLLRLTIGVRRKLEKWPSRVAAPSITHSRPTAPLRHTLASSAPRSTT